MGRKIESNAVSLIKQNDPKQNCSFPANMKCKARVLIAANNNIYGTIRKKIFTVFDDIKCQTNNQYCCLQTILLSKNQFDKHNHLNKVSTLSNFFSVLILLFTFFLHVILINSTIYFLVDPKFFDSSLSGGYDYRQIFLP